MGQYPTGPALTISPRVTSMADPGPLAIFCFWGIVLLVCTSFLIYKKIRTSNGSSEAYLRLGSHSITAQARSSSTGDSSPGEVSPKAGLTEETHLNVEEDEQLEFFPYKDTVWGRTAYLLACLTSLQWLALYIVILLDFYQGCQVGGIDNLCFFGTHFIFGSYLLNGEILFVVWWLSLFWFFTWVSCKGRVRNWFRMPCRLSEANVVYVWARDQHDILTLNPFPLVHFVRSVQAAMRGPKGRGHGSTIDIQRTPGGQRYFMSEGARFLVHGDGLERAQLKVGETYADFHHAAKGLDGEEARLRLDHVGPNEIPFRVDTVWQLIFNELFSFFYCYQLIMYLLWFWSSYLFIACILAAVVLTSAAVQMYIAHRCQKAMAKVTEYVTECTVLRGGKYVAMISTELVPGDVVSVRGDWLLPCDLLILQGSCVCDESNLTGEAMPVQKYACPLEESPYDPKGGARHTLFAGTTVLQAGTAADATVRAVVTATGMATSKGDLMSTILYPTAMIFKYDEELPIVVTLLVTYALCCAVLALVFQVRSGQQSVWVTKWIYVVFIISQIMSPILPVALSVGQMHAMNRLRKNNIFCLNPKRIAICGKIRIQLFDKTGTLTKDGLDFLGAIPVAVRDDNYPSNGSEQKENSSAANGMQGSHSLHDLSEEILPPARAGEVNPLVLMGLATCHAVSRFGEQLVGNQVEVKMFGGTGWKLVEAPDEAPVVRAPGTPPDQALAITRRNEFDHARMTMSVVVSERASKQLHVFCKGSFERMAELCTPESLPGNAAHLARKLSLDGCYVLALAHRALGALRLEQAATQSREQLESGLTFLGLIAFRNELKPDTRSAILALKAGNVRTVMVTGDNAQCGHYIAKECGMIGAEARVMLGDVDGASGDVAWSLMDSSADSGAARALSTPALMEKHALEMDRGALELAVTGKALDVLLRSERMRRLLFSTRIFARCTPEQKVVVADLHRNRGLVVGMCGDGGNDCGALRVAHAGIALSEAEASVVSPFTSRTKSVQSCVDLLREGRGALHTSFAAYKFLIIYGLQFSLLKLCCYYYGVIVCQMDYIMIDGIAVLSLGYAITLSKPARKLDQDRPTSSLLGPLNVASVLGVWVLNIVFLVGALYLMQADPDYVPWPARYSLGASWWTLGDNWESTVLFFTLYFQFITASYIYSFGGTFRRAVFFNWALCTVWLFLVVLMSTLLLMPPGQLTFYWHIASHAFNSPETSSPVWAAYQAAGGAPSPGMSFGFRIRLWLLNMGSLAAIMLWQKVVAEGPVSNLLRRTFPSNRPQFNM